MAGSGCPSRDVRRRRKIDADPATLRQSPLAEVASGSDYRSRPDDFVYGQWEDKSDFALLASIIPLSYKVRALMFECYRRDLRQSFDEHWKTGLEYYEDQVEDVKEDIFSIAIID